MHSMINRALEGFLRGTYGDALWMDVLRIAQVEQLGFLTRNSPNRRATRRVLNAASHELNKPVDELLEDMGAWLVRLEPIRRLLRFSGRDYGEFVLALDELPGRARMILPEIPLRDLFVKQSAPGEYTIGADDLPVGWIWAIAGALRGMADDYGTLALIAVSGNRISLSIALEEHAMCRPFQLSVHHIAGPAA